MLRGGKQGGGSMYGVGRGPGAGCVVPEGGGGMVLDAGAWLCGGRVRLCGGRVRLYGGRVRLCGCKPGSYQMSY